MELKTILFIKKDGYKKEYPVTISDGNIIPDVPNKLPNCTDDMVNFTFQYREMYSKTSKSKVNTRFLYPYSRNYKASGREGYCEAYAFLSYLQRIKLSHIAGTIFYRKHKKFTISIIIALLGTIAAWIQTFSSNNSENTQPVKSKTHQELENVPNETDSLQLEQKEADTLQLKQKDDLKSK